MEVYWQLQGRTGGDWRRGGDALGGAASGAVLGANRLLLNMVLLVSPAEDHKFIVPAGLQHKISKLNLGS